MLNARHCWSRELPKGPQGQKRPADTIANAIRVAKILTGEIAEDTGADDGKDKGAQALGRRSNLPDVD
jgi:hypothetical protein